MVRAPLEFGLQSGSGSGSDRIQGSNWVQVQAPIGFGLHSGSSSDRVQAPLEFRLRSGLGSARVRALLEFGLRSGCSSYDTEFIFKSLFSTAKFPSCFLIISSLEV